MSGDLHMAYLLYDGEQLLDGEIRHGADACCRYLGYLTEARFVDLRIYVTDFAEARRDGKTTTRDVTEDMVRMAWERGDLPNDSALAQEHVPEARQYDGGWRDLNAEHRTYRAGAL